MLLAFVVIALAPLPTCGFRVNAVDSAAIEKASLSVEEKKEVTVEGLLQTEGRSPYKYVQQVGLSLYTFPEGFGKAGVKSFYQGVDNTMKNGGWTTSGSITDDVNERLKIMQDMMEVAYESQFYSRDESVLKVFMAPEFFFRGPHGAYDMRNLAGCPIRYKSGEICDMPVMTILQSLSESVKDAKWKDWVFVFGTIVSFVGSSKYYNFAPVLRGGPGNPIHHIVSKTFVSGIDFLDCPNGIDGDGGWCVRNPQNLGAGEYDVFSKNQIHALAKSGFQLQHHNKFKIEGITFGLEVCLDHAQKELAEHPEGVQVHLIVSAGMAIQWTVPRLQGASSNAPVFLQDGGAGGAHTQYYCPGCPYLAAGTWAGRPPYNPASIVQSPRPQESFDSRKHNATRHNLHGKTFSTDPSRDPWFSPRGFGTEGTGLGVDPRFASVRINHIFANDDFRPAINIGPAFEVPVPATQQPPSVRPDTAKKDYSCVCLKRWNTAAHGSCDNGCCHPAQNMPYGWCVTYKKCKGNIWKACGSREGVIAN